MKILLTHAYFIHEDIKEQKIMRPYPPLGILYLASYLKKNGLPAEVFDTTFSSWPTMQSFLLKHTPKYLCVYVNLMTKLNVLRLISFVRDQPELKHTKIILGGPEVKHSAEKFLGHGADVIVKGEGEVTLQEIISTLDTPLNPFWGQVKGIVFQNALGEIVHTDEREKMRSIDELVPDRASIDLNLYLKSWRKHHGQSTVSISTMRGCPYTCRWCSRAVYGLSYRRRSPEKVVEEMAQIQEAYTPDSLWFVDDVFTISHKWLKGFTEALRARNLKIPFECITRADRMNEEVIEMLAEAGCFRVWIGAESGSQKIIDKMDRRVEVGQVRDMIQLAQKNGIQAGTFIMLGYPGETEEDIRATVEHLKASDPDYFTITTTYPIKGTELYEEVEPTMSAGTNWETHTDRDIEFKRAYPRRYYDFAVRWVSHEVNFNKLKKKKAHMSIGGLATFIKAKAARSGMWWQRTFSNGGMN